MRIVASFDPTSATSGSFNTTLANGTGRMVVYNESNVNVQLGWGSFVTYCPAWTAMLYCVNASSPQIAWSQQSQLAANNAPISQVIVEAYDANEPVLGSYPAPLVRQTNLGNNVPLATAATAIQNDGSVAGTTLIEATPSDAASSTWQADNKGNLTIKSDNAGALSTLLQLVAGANPAITLGAPVSLQNFLTNTLGGKMITGSTGTVTLYQWWRGSFLISEFYFNGYSNSGAGAQNLALGVAYQRLAQIAVGGVLAPNTLNLQFLASGVAQVIHFPASFTGGSFASGTTVKAYVPFAEVTSGWDTLAIPNGYSGPATGWIHVVGV